MKIYILVRKTEDVEFNPVSVLQSVHSTALKADEALENLVDNIGVSEEDYEILEREMD